jgi:hypothetical protein
MAHDVFLSYSTKDKSAAEAVCAALERSGIGVWMAPRDIAPGVSWASSIVEAIDNARTVVLIFSSAANDSPQIEREVQHALEKNLRVVPFRVEDVKPREGLAYCIGAVQWLDAFAPPIDGHYEALSKVVRKIAPLQPELTQPAANMRVNAAPPPSPRAPRRPMKLLQILAVLLAALLVVSGIVGWQLLKPSDIHVKWLALGGASSFLGQPLTDELGTPDGLGRFNHFQGGSIYWKPGIGAHEVHGEIRDKWGSMGWERSPFGYPLSDETPTPDGLGRFNHFQGGSIYWKPGIGAHEVHGAIRDKWSSMGWERSFLGYPTSDEISAPGGGRVSNFEQGSISWTASGGAIPVVAAAAPPPQSPKPELAQSPGFGIQFGTDKTPQEAQHQVELAKKNPLISAEAIYIFRKDGWWKSVAKFNTEEEAKNQLDSFRPVTYDHKPLILNLSSWCPSPRTLSAETKDMAEKRDCGP